LKFFASIVVMIGFVVLSGCGASSGPRLPTVPVKGKLLIDGKSYGNCTVILSATTVDPDPKLAAANKSVTGVVKEDGTFVLTTYKEGDGAPAGTYEVTVASDMSDPKSVMTPVPVCKPTTVVIAKSSDGKPVEIEVKLESTGEGTSIGAGTVGIGSGSPVP